MRLLNIIIGLFLCTTLYSQYEYEELPERPKLREVEVNMTTLLTQILPFQSFSGLDGPFQFQFKSGRSNHLFSFKMGLRLNDNGFLEDDNYLNLGIGYNRRRSLGKHFNLNIGYHFIIMAGSFNDPVNTIAEDVGLGFGWDIGFQYNINSRFSVGTSTMLFGGTTSNGLIVTIIPPVGIFLAGRLN